MIKTPDRMNYLQKMTYYIDFIDKIIKVDNVKLIERSFCKHVVIEEDCVKNKSMHQSHENNET